MSEEPAREVTCPACQGDCDCCGWQEDDSPCSTCGGSGVLRVGDVVDDADNLIRRPPADGT